MIEVARLRGRMAAALPSSIIQNAAAVSGAALATAALGYVFWWLAARVFPPAAIGFAAAVTSAMTLLGTLGVFGLGTLLIAELGRQPGGAGRLVALAMTCAGAFAAVLGVAFAAFSPSFSPELAALAAPWPMAMFGLGVGLTAAAIVLDQALVGLLRGSVQLWRNVVFGVMRLAGLGVIGGLAPRDGGGLAIIATWVAASLVSMWPLGHLLRIRQQITETAPRAARRIDWQRLRSTGRAAVAHHALNVGLQVPALALPVLVAVLLSATDNAYFYVAWMLAGVVFLGSSALTLALYAVGVRDRGLLRRHTRFTLALGLAGGAAAALVLYVLSDTLLGLLFGAGYPERAGPILRMLTVAACPLVIIDHYVALCRIEGRALAATRLVIPGSVAQLLIAGLGARLGGLSDLSLGWVIGVGLEAALMLPLVYGAVAPRRANT